MIYGFLDHKSDHRALAMTDSMLALEIREIMYRAIDISALRNDRVFLLFRTLTDLPEDMFKLEKNELALQTKSINISAETVNAQSQNASGGVPPERVKAVTPVFFTKLTHSGIKDEVELRWQNAFFEFHSNVGIVALIMVMMLNLKSVTCHMAPSHDPDSGRGLEYTVHELLEMRILTDQPEQPLSNVVRAAFTLGGKVHKLPSLPLLQDLALSNTEEGHDLNLTAAAPAIKTITCTGSHNMATLSSPLERNLLPGLTELHMVYDSPPLDFSTDDFSNFAESIGTSNLPKLRTLTWDFQYYIIHDPTSPPSNDPLLEGSGLTKITNLSTLRVHRDLLFAYRQRKVFPAIYNMIPRSGLKTLTVTGLLRGEVAYLVKQDLFDLAPACLDKIVLVFYFDQMEDLGHGDAARCFRRYQAAWQLQKDRAHTQHHKVFEVHAASVGSTYIEEQWI